MGWVKTPLLLPTSSAWCLLSSQRRSLGWGGEFISKVLPSVLHLLSAMSLHSHPDPVGLSDGPEARSIWVHSLYPGLYPGASRRRLLRARGVDSKSLLAGG